MKIFLYAVALFLLYVYLSYYYDKRKKRKLATMLIDTIFYNRDIIVREEGKTTKEAEYLAICALLDDLQERPKGASGKTSVIKLVQDYFPYHFNDVLTYLSWKSGLLPLKAEFEEKLIARHAISDKQFRATPNTQ